MTVEKLGIARLDHPQPRWTGYLRTGGVAASNAARDDAHLWYKSGAVRCRYVSLLRGPSRGPCVGRADPHHPTDVA